MRTIAENHPYLVVKEIINSYGSYLKFEFGIYIHQKQTIDDIREYILLDARETTKERIKRLIRSLRADSELALHSRVHFKTGEVLHIPMIDFCGSVPTEAWDLIRDILPRDIVENFKIFESGSSYHAYSTELLSQEDWIRFMGIILLLNPPDGESMVDTRWVGHRLLGGFGSLRWSCNTLQYKKLPTLVNNRNLFTEQKNE